MAPRQKQIGDSLLASDWPINLSKAGSPGLKNYSLLFALHFAFSWFKLDKSFVTSKLLINRSFHRYSLTATINFCGMGQAKCEICHKLLANRRSVRRHRKEVHKIYPQANSFECTECGLTTRSLYELTGHMTVQLAATSPRYCIYCQKCFPRDADYLEHMTWTLSTVYQLGV